MLVAQWDVDVESSGCGCLILNGQLALSEQFELVGGLLAESFADGLADPRAINAIYEPVFGSSDGQFPASPRPNDRRCGVHVPIVVVVFDWLHIPQQVSRTGIQRQDTVGV